METKLTFLATPLLFTLAVTIDTFGVGMDTGSPVSNTYKPPFTFTGAMHEVRVALKWPNFVLVYRNL